MMSDEVRIRHISAIYLHSLNFLPLYTNTSRTIASTHYFFSQMELRRLLRFVALTVAIALLFSSLPGVAAGDNSDFQWGVGVTQLVLILLILCGGWCLGIFVCVSDATSGYGED